MLSRHALVIAASRSAGASTHALRGGQADASQKHSRRQQKPVLQDPTLHHNLLQCFRWSSLSA